MRRALSSAMRAVVVDGGRAVVSEIPMPVLSAGQALVRVAASGVNRADTLQRRGGYPPPAGAPAGLGLECAGVVVAYADGVRPPLPLGSRVMAIVSGGGNAEFAAVPAGSLMRVPSWCGAGADASPPSPAAWARAAALPEAWLTAFQLLHCLGEGGPAAADPSRLAGKTVLIHAAASGVGTAALQLALGCGADVVAVCGGPAKGAAVAAAADRLRAAAGAAAGSLLAVLDYKATPAWGAAARAASRGGAGADVALDCVGGGGYWRENADALAVDGRWVVYGSLGGVDVDGALFAAVLRKRLRIVGTTLRGRSDEYKAALAAAFVAHAAARLDAGVYAPVLDRVMPLADVQAAHDAMERGDNVGKIVLAVAGVDTEGVGGAPPLQPA
jgi:tumor protein p53-inducible protein 3